MVKNILLMVAMLSADASVTRIRLMAVGLVVFILVLRYVIIKVVGKAADKGFDAIRNAKVREQEEKNPAKAERLADRYKTIESTTEDN